MLIQEEEKRKQAVKAAEASMSPDELQTKRREEANAAEHDRNKTAHFSALGRNFASSGRGLPLSGRGGMAGRGVPRTGDA